MLAIKQRSGVLGSATSVRQICAFFGVVSCMLIPSISRAETFNTGAVLSSSLSAIDAQADFTVVSAGHIQVVLTDLLKNPVSVGQLISGIKFTVSGGSGSGVTTTNSGYVTNVSSGGSYTTGVLDPLLNWQATQSTTLIDLFASSPDRLIIGPDDKGNLDPSFGGKYSAAKGSIADNIPHNPFTLGSGTFKLTITGVTSTSIITDVVFQFGTTAGTDTATGNPPPIPNVANAPEPGSLTLLGLGLASFGGIALMKRRNAKAVAV